MVTEVPEDLGSTVSIDLEYMKSESKSVDPLTARLYCVTFCDQPGRAFLLMYKQREAIQKLFSSSRKFLWWNWKSDVKVLLNEKYEVDIVNPPEDGMLLGFLDDPNDSCKLENVAARLLGINHPSFDPMIYESRDYLLRYACGDAELHYLLYHRLLPRVDATKYFLERSLLPVLHEMEATGIRVNQSQLKNLQARMSQAVELVKIKIYKLAGEEFELNSPTQVSRIVYEKLKVPHPPVKLKSGYYSTGKREFGNLQRYEIVKLISMHRRLVKRKGTYVDALWQHIRPDGKVHTDILQVVTPTLRLASTAPNMMNQPKHHESALEKSLDVRCIFEADPGHYIMRWDYKQIEFRLLIYSCGNRELRQRMESGEDFHVTTQNIVLSAGVVGFTRDNAKTFNYAITYGADEYSLQFRFGFSGEQMRAIMREYDRQFAGVRPWMKEEKRWALETGCSRTFMGKLRTLPLLKSPNRADKEKALRNVINDNFQGGAAAIFKMGMIRLFKIRNYPFKFLLPVHDEVLVQVPDSVPPHKLAAHVRSRVEVDLGAMGKYPVDIEVGRSWTKTQSLN